MTITNATIFALISYQIIYVILQAGTVEQKIVPTQTQSFVEMMYEFVYRIVYENVGIKGRAYFPFIFVLFLYVLAANLLGMVPYSFTITSHIIVTFLLSSSIFIGVTILGFSKHKLKFFGFFLPNGSPMWLGPMIVIIETLSYISRAFSLAIRLFANMMSGHSLLKILAGFSWTMLSMGGIYYILALVPAILVFIITGLEIGIAILQAYVFTVLTCLYLNDSLNLH
jgi:ATP synthase subunit 6